MNARCGLIGTFISLVLILALLAPAPLMTSNAATPLDPSGWKPIQDAIESGLPKTAIEEIEKQLPKALEQNDDGLIIRLLATRATLDGMLEGGGEVHRIVRLQADMETAPASTKPVINAILANWFWSYYQQNQWRFQNRTEIDPQVTGAAEPVKIKSVDDITTWSRQRIIGQSAALFEAALNSDDGSEKTLRQTPIGDYDDLLVKGSAPDEYRPTLYDFVVADAIDFYNDAHQTYAGPAARFELMADSPIFADVDAFLRWQVPNTDAASPLRRATTLYQDWLEFHRGDDDSTALIDADLHRLDFARDHAIGDPDGDRLEEALKSFIVRYKKSPLSTRAQFHLATHARQNNELVRAHSIAQSAIDAHPESLGARQCAVLIEQIEAPSIEIATEQIWNPDLDEAAQAKINVKYRNTTTVYFRLVKLDYQALREAGQQPRYTNRDQRIELMASDPVASWSADLPPTEDYRDSTEHLPAHLDVPRGAYYLIASTSEDFPLEGEYTALTDVWISGLSIVVESRYDDQVIVGYLVNGRSGEPLGGAKIDVWGQSRSNRGRQEASRQTTLQTNEQGRFAFDSTGLRGVNFLATHGDDQLWSRTLNSYGNRNRGSEDHDVTRSHFFTDRSIYRPGQVLRYKVICTRSNATQNEYQVSADQQITVELLDANNKVVHTANHRCNELGSCHGSFNLPASGLTGGMMLRTTGAFQGATSIRVEEYKRPKFEVKIEAPTDPVRLGEPVTVSGEATAYTSAAIDGAKVSYRVIRKTEFPVWWRYRCWWLPPSPQPEQTIAEGTTTTDETGKFSVTFDALPDQSVDRESEPKFRYEITADVTDTTGETRDAVTSVLIGYTTMEATLSTSQANWLSDEQPIEINVATKTLQGDAVSAKVKVDVYSLKKPESIGRKRIGNSGVWDRLGVQPGQLDENEDKVRAEEPNSWPQDKIVKTVELTTDAAGSANFEVELGAGNFRAVLSAVDSAGNDVQAILPLQVIDPDAERCELAIASLFATEKNSYQPGETFRAVWGSGYAAARAFVEVTHRGKSLQQFWTSEDRTQVEITQDIDESMRGGFQVRVWMVRENRLYLHQTHVNVPWSDKELSIRWEHFVSKLKPGQQETWTAVIEGPGGDASDQGEAAMQQAAEMVATLYDASLDAFTPHVFHSGFGLFYQDRDHVSIDDQNQWDHLQQISSHSYRRSHVAQLTYRQYPVELQSHAHRPGRMQALGRSRGVMPMMMAESAVMADGAEPAAAPKLAMKAGAAADVAEEGMLDSFAASADDTGAADKKNVDLSDVAPRKNLNETAFFFPDLLADDDGVVRMNFTMPEALTRWQFIGFAHTADLAGGLLRDTAVTSKDLMVQPNPPRVLREGDEIEITVKVTNQSPTVQSGTVALQFSSARTGDSVDNQLSNAAVRQSFEIPAGRSQSFSWPIRVPDGIGFLTYKAVGSTGRLSDGEEGYLPVLSRKILVHESIALPVDGKETKTFTLDKLADLNPDSSSIRSESLTVQMTSNPAWYAVMALPYLMDYPYECSEQTFNRLYANLLARHIATSDPKIERVFDVWRNQPMPSKDAPGGRDTLASPLQQNEELASIALTETPWVLEAESESEARRNVGILFDQNRVNDQVQRLTRRLIDVQADDGSWPWFPGGRSNSFITLYIATGYGRLRHLGADVDASPAIKALAHLDAFSKKLYDDIDPDDRNQNHLSSTIALYLYGRSFFLGDADVAVDAKPALEYWLDQAAEHWLELPRMSEAHVAIALKRFGRADDAGAIVRSLKERSLTDDTGMHWNDEVRGWFWYQADIETQAMMIEVFDEVAADQSSVESCKAWLLRQKETRSWETTKATADAVYALLLRGVDILADQTLVDVKVGEQAVEQESVEAGTGFYEQRFTAAEIKPEMGSITVTKTTPGIAWGGVHWSFFQNVDEVTPHEGTPLEIQKQLFVVRSTPSGEVLRPIVGGLVAGAGADSTPNQNVDADGTPIEVGDEIVSRLIVRASRAMEFIHLKDSRGSGTEPTNVLSGYRWQDALGYYQSTRDAAEHFFIDDLPKGTYVLESRSRVQLKGQYQSGLATIESMYAPQYNSHSESYLMKVGE
ncbi:alpha-2-macroglobulin family protein [Allorhodopirellula solitaria]|uniref:MG2 domain protein n=2 Tax=Allorhodopirellula solitaria TaxID=2527987 RepID=A0A5C5XTG2_9BACT|nr:alpha-2-macroglobulin family protein [Allorhodopirellula solitaria]TWT66200.1 MG2 domain protein [Allorhodopirellula solitaria]